LFHSDQAYVSSTRAGPILTSLRVGCITVSNQNYFHKVYYNTTDTWRQWFMGL